MPKSPITENRSLIESIKLTNFLSFGSESKEIPLGSLNIVIGPNGSGKSNLMEAFDVLRSAPSSLRDAISNGGGIHDLIWKGGSENAVANIEVKLNEPKSKVRENLRYKLEFRKTDNRFELRDEVLECVTPKPKEKDVYFYYRYHAGHSVINVKGDKRELKREYGEQDASVFELRKDSEQYPEITAVGKMFSDFRLFREWTFGRKAMPRSAQKADLLNDFLFEDSSNLGLILNRFEETSETERYFLEALREIYDGANGLYIKTEGGTVQIHIKERDFNIPATRLSDGTLRYLSLLAILCHPDPPPLICIEEPELGLHPDIIPTIARLLKKASERTQLIVTTHSDVLVDCMTDTPESVLVCEKTEEGTQLTRPDPAQLKILLKKYRLGELWTSGDLGGNRW